MSATGRGARRAPHDYYPTPAWCVHRLLEHVPIPSGEWLDPCAGDGELIRAARAVRSDVSWHAVELRPECASELEEVADHPPLIGDYLAAPVASLRCAAIVTNPPYSLAQRFLEKALLEAPYVVMLLRLNYLGSAKRWKFMREMPPDVYVLPNRPSFEKGRTDSCEYGWFVWGPVRRRPHGLVSVLKTTPRAERIRERALPRRQAA